GATLGVVREASADAPSTTSANATARRAPSAPPGSDSPNTASPATIGTEFVRSVATPAVASGPPRWNPSWSATNARPWHESSAGTNARRQPPWTAAFVPTSPAAYRIPAAAPRPAPGASHLAPGTALSAAASVEQTSQSAADAIDPERPASAPPASDAPSSASPAIDRPTP